VKPICRVAASGTLLLAYTPDPALPEEWTVLVQDGTQTKGEVCLGRWRCDEKEAARRLAQISDWDCHQHKQVVEVSSQG